MAIRSGLGTQCGFKTEVSYGTYIAPTRFIPITSESLALEKTYIRSQGLRAGRLSQSQDLHVDTTRTAAGDVVFELLNQGMGLFFNMLHGNTVTPTLLTGTAFTQSHAIGLTDPYGKSLTAQIGRPDTGGTVDPFSYLGCKVMGMSIQIDSGGLASVTMTLDAQDETTGSALATPTYTVGAVPFNFTQAVCSVGGSSIGNVRSLTINIQVPQATDRFHLGNTGKKDQPITDQYVAVSADATLEFASLADHTRFTAATVVAFDCTLTGALISGANYFKAQFAMPATKQVSDAPQAQGPGILTTSASFEALDNGSAAPLTITYVNTDVTL